MTLGWPQVALLAWGALAFARAAFRGRHRAVSRAVTLACLGALLWCGGFFGGAACKKLPALEHGADIQVRRLEATLQWFSDHWPKRVAWPDGVKRPARTQEPA